MIREGQFYQAWDQITGFDIYRDEPREEIIFDAGDAFQVYDHSLLYDEESDSIVDLVFVVTPTRTRFQIYTENVIAKAKRISMGTYEMALNRYPTIPEGPFD